MTIVIIKFYWNSLLVAPAAVPLVRTLLLVVVAGPAAGVVRGLADTDEAVLAVEILPGAITPPLEDLDCLKKKK